MSTRIIWYAPSYVLCSILCQVMSQGKKSPEHAIRKVSVVNLPSKNLMTF